VNLIEPGSNYGWPVITGDQHREGMVPPILQSGDRVTWAPSGATFASRGPWAGALLFAGLRGQALYRLGLDPADPRRVTSFQVLFEGRFGRLRDVVEGPDGAPDDDRLIRLVVR
jgi:glucose/arabinose dehydrogenase